MSRHASVRFFLVGLMGFASGCHAPPRTGGPSTASALSSDARPAVDAKRPSVLISTTLGDILIALDVEKAPATVLNFARYVESKYYDGTVFHRVLKDSMIQGGGYTPAMAEKPLHVAAAVPDLWANELENRRGSIALIRPKEGSGRHTAQFYINLKDNLELDSAATRDRYRVFGRVVEGMDTVERIRHTPVGTHPRYADGRSAVVPTKPVVIRSMRLLGPLDWEALRAAADDSRDWRELRLEHLIRKLEKEAGREIVTTESGLRYIDRVVGRGSRPLADSFVEFHYRGTFLDGTEFESSYDFGPALRKLDSLIPGLREGLATMNEGGQRTLIVPPKLAFGSSGIPAKIPPDATLVYELELLEVR